MLDKTKFLKLAESKYVEINALNDKPTMMDYERGLRDLMNELGQSIMNEQLSGTSQDRRKKKPSPPPTEK